MAKKEFISRIGGKEGSLHCLCGNIDAEYGFYPCDSKGKLIEPDKGVWKNLYICDHCGRIINHITLRVVGRKKLKLSRI
jgi:hypothetical protein